MCFVLLKIGWRISAFSRESLIGTWNQYYSSLRLRWILRVLRNSWWVIHIWEVLCQKQVSRAGRSNYIPHYLWDVITCPCPWYLHLAQNSWYMVVYCKKLFNFSSPWWRHQRETFSALLAICAGNSPVPGEFPAQRPVTRSFDVFFDLRLNKRLSKQSRGWWFETLSRQLWRQCNAQF